MTTATIDTIDTTSLPHHVSLADTVQQTMTMA